MPKIPGSKEARDNNISIRLPRSFTSLQSTQRVKLSSFAQWRGFPNSHGNPSPTHLPHESTARNPQSHTARTMAGDVAQTREADRSRAARRL